jgi:Zn-dependent protease with chaperone function
MTAASLVGFGLVLVLGSFALSTVATLALRITGPRLRASGPWAERRAAALAILVPPLLALGLTALLAVGSTLALRAGADHCLEDGYHRHLCVVHGAAWASEPWALGPLLGMLLLLVGRAVRCAAAHARAQRSVSALRAAALPIPGEPRGLLVPLERPVVFTAGLVTPAIVVARGAWDRLAARERVALLAHERAHLEHGDLWLRALLYWAACLGAPGLARWALRRWEAAAERACDLRAAAAVGEPATVASALVTRARARASALAPAAAVLAAGDHLVERVEALLGPRTADGRRAGLRLVSLVLAASVIGLLAGAWFIEPLHHLIETILG